MTQTAGFWIAGSSGGIRRRNNIFYLNLLSIISPKLKMWIGFQPIRRVSLIILRIMLKRWPIPGFSTQGITSIYVTMRYTIFKQYCLFKEIS